jgi:type II secretory pathway component PulF
MHQRTRQLLLEKLPVLLAQGRTPLAALTQLGFATLPEGPYILKELNKGKGLAEAAESQFTTKETRVLEVGEQTGQLGAALLGLFDLQEQKRTTKWKLILGSTYPVGLLFGAGLLIPTSALLAVINTRNWEQFFIYKTTEIGVVVLCLCLAIAGWVSLTATTKERIILRTPGLGHLWKSIQTSIFARTMQWLMKTSTDIGTAAKLAAECGNSPELLAEAEQWQLTARSATPVFATSRVLHRWFAEDLQTYEETGNLANKIDEMVKKAKQTQQTSTLRLITTLTSGCYLLSIVLAGYAIVSFYAGYFDLIFKQL